MNKVTVTDPSDSNSHDIYIKDPITNIITEHPGQSSLQGEQQLPALVLSSDGSNEDLNHTHPVSQQVQ